MTQPPARVPVPAKYEHFYVLWALQLARNILSAHIIMVTCSRHPIVSYIASDTLIYLCPAQSCQYDRFTLKVNVGMVNI